MKHVLLVEDDMELHELIKKIVKNTYKTTSAYSGTEAMLLLEKNSFDLILLDMMLPGITGDSLLVKIREYSNVPIIILTAISDKKIITKLLLDGANDYITKPFDNDELLARIQVQLRNQTPSQEIPNSLSYKNIELSLDSFKIANGKISIDLSKKEAEILRLLIQSPNKIFTKQDIYEKIWQDSYYGDENTINVHISNLRKKIVQLDDKETYIDTVWSIGIKLAE